MRRFLPDPVSDADVMAAIDSARWAPSPHNSQPWRFALVRPGPAREKLAIAMADRWLVDLARHREADPRVLRLVAQRKQRLLEAPVALVVSMTAEGLDAYPDADRRAAEWLTAEQSLGAAIQNVLLTLHSRGLGSCWICAPAFCPDTCRDALDLPADWEPRALVLAGYPAVQPAEPPRKPVSEIVLVR